MISLVDMKGELLWTFYFLDRILLLLLSITAEAILVIIRGGAGSLVSSKLTSYSISFMYLKVVYSCP